MSAERKERVKDPGKLMTPREVAAMLRCKPQHVYRTQDKIPGRVKLGAKMLRFYREDVEKWIEEQRG